MSVMKGFSKIWKFLKQDTWPSWLVSIILIVIGIKFIFFPVLSLITGAPLPLVVIESCSMYHNENFENWWQTNAAWYQTHNITKTQFENFPFKNGLNKGDIIFVWGHDTYEKGNVIIFNAKTRYPIIHRITIDQGISTKGDNGRTNPDRLPNGLEENIPQHAIVGKAVGRIPLLGWVKLIFFEKGKSVSERGFCK